MAGWSNGPLTLYHGTNTVTRAEGAGSVQGALASFFVPNLSLCRPFTDFGQGFYTTTSLDQAREWANARTRRASKPRQYGPSLAVVLAFSVDRDWLASLESIVFPRAIQDYWTFVTACRTGLAPHGRAAGRGPFDVVYGPVTIWPQRLLIADCDQVSFHTQAALRALPTPVVAAVASTPSGLFD